MKKFKNSFRLWLFERLVRLLFKISQDFKLIKFERVENNGVIDYKAIMRVKSENDINTHASEHLKNKAKRNSLIEKPNLHEWENEGFFHRSARKRAETFISRGGTKEVDWEEYAKENHLYRFLDEEPSKYKERVRSAINSGLKLNPNRIILNDQDLGNGFIGTRFLEKAFSPQLTKYTSSKEGFGEIPVGSELDQSIHKLQGVEMNKPTSVDKIAKQIIKKF